MLPVQLTINGLYSYAQPVTINFQPLVDAKLFGIFGPVGSGKSAILEAIMFVLFDRSNRLNRAGDDRYYNMMNLQSREMSIDFIFRGGRNHRNKYRFYFLARRNAKDFQKVEVKDRSYYQWAKNDWIPLEKPDVLGMTYENFMQTVIIPQGQFREFIDQKPAARTLMLKELFHLDRFDIASKAFQQLAVAKERHSFLEGQLSQFDELNKAVLKQLSKEIATITKDIEKKVKWESNLTKETHQLEILRHLHQELSEVSEILSTLESEQLFYQQKHHQLKRFLKIKQVFQERIMRQRELLQDAKNKKQELSEAIINDHGLTKEVETVRANWQHAQSEFATKDRIQLQIEDLGLLQDIMDLKDRLDSSLLRQEQVNLKIGEMEKVLKTMGLELENIQKLENAKQKAQQELQLLTQINGWWKLQLVNEKQLKSLGEEIAATQRDVEGILAAKQKLLSGLEDSSKIKSEIAHNREQLQQLLVQDDWRIHASHLKEGKPCPLCGSVEHPKPLSNKSLQPQINALRGQLNALETSLDKQQRLVEEAKIMTAKVEEKQQALERLNLKYQQVKLDHTRNQKVYPGNKIPVQYPRELERNINEKKQRIEIVTEELAKLRSKREQYHKIEKQREVLTLKLPGILSEKENLQGKIEQITGMLKTPVLQTHLDKTPDELKQMSAQLVEKMRSIDINYKNAMDQVTISEQKLNHHKGLLQSLEKQIAKIQEDTDRLEAGLMKDCKKESLKGLKEAQKILALGLDPEVEEQELEQYHTNLKAARIRQQSLQKKMGRKHYDGEKHQELNEQLQDLKIELKQLNHKLSNTQFTLEQYKTRLEKKDVLEKELKEVTDRKNSIQEISNLLRGNGFINFISSVYLQNLCKSANVRFTKLTGNRLSLELSPQNEFLVRDHLNDGKLRLLKTLSGGQIFQASLSLALSLAENVKNLNQADQSFFFLDEGFGSLDRISLRLVFETLKTLQNENRIVGIISHVEDLQQEIDTFLEVTQDPDKGSLIRSSWAISE
jgi:exonuclease SbcC